MAYTKTTWANGGTPAINETNLNNIEDGIDGVYSSITAGESMNIGDALYIDKSTGKAKVLTFDKNKGALVTLSSGVNTGSTCEVYPTDDVNKVVAIYYTSTTTIKARVVDLTDISSPSLGTEVTLTTGATGSFFSCQLSDTVVIVTFRGTTTVDISSSHLSVNTTTDTVTATANADIVTDQFNDSYRVGKIDSTHFALLYRRSTDTGLNYVTVSGTTITAGTTSQIYASSAATYNVELIDTNVLVCHYDTSKTRVAYWNGSSWTYGTEQSNGAIAAGSTIRKIDTNKFMNAYFNSGGDNVGNYLRVWSVDGSYDSEKLIDYQWIPPVVDSDFSPKNICYDSDTEKLYTHYSYIGYLSFLEVRSLGKDGSRFNLVTVIPEGEDDYSGTPTRLQLTGTLPQRNTTILRNKSSSLLVRALYSTNASNYRMALDVVPTFDRFYEFIGFANESASTNDVISIKPLGTIKGLSGLTTGTVYYVQEDGSYGTTVTQFKIGTAISTTEIAISTEINIGV